MMAVAVQVLMADISANPKRNSTYDFSSSSENNDSDQQECRRCYSGIGEDKLTSISNNTLNILKFEDIINSDKFVISSRVDTSPKYRRFQKVSLQYKADRDQINSGVTGKKYDIHSCCNFIRLYYQFYQNKLDRSPAVSHLIQLF